jgi:ankyrin repeat protein
MTVRPQGTYTPLHLAAMSGNTDAVAALIDCKADVKTKDKVWGLMGA